MVSNLFDIATKKGLQMVFSFIVSMMETAMKSTPNTKPTKPGLQREREVNSFYDEVLARAYANIEESGLVPSDCNEVDAIDLSGLFYSLYIIRLYFTLVTSCYSGVLRGHRFCFRLFLSDT